MKKLQYKIIICRDGDGGNMTQNIETFSITTLSIMGLNVIFSTNDTHNNVMLNVVFFTAIICGVMLSIVILLLC
jgi:hypothetical protein